MTKTMPVSSGPTSIGGFMGKEDTRKIVGILISFTWQPQGQLFPIREGKNFVGSDKVYSDASHQDCDIQIKEDERMSGEHALILCRGGVYEIIDQTSSNGTFLNGDMLPANQSQKLENYSEIKAGSTLFIFIKIAPPKGAEERVSPPPTRKEEKKTEQEVDDKRDTFVK
jgi:pSer/pThr/pTyr-binding forkhead associated (FHA) protein